MRKKILNFILFFIVVCGIPYIVHAALPIDSTQYTFRRDGCELMPLNGSGDYGINLYYVYLIRNGPSGFRNFSSVDGEGILVPAYCIEPLQSDGEYDGGTVTRRVDPANDENKTAQAWSVAMTSAYSSFSNEGLNGTSNEERAIHEIVYRWINYHYGYSLEQPSNRSSSNEQCVGFGGTGGYKIRGDLISTLFSNPSSTYWNKSGSAYQVAKPIYDKAVAAGDKVKSGTKYEEYLEQDTSIWKDEYTFKVTSTSSGGGERITVDMTAQDVDKIFWTEFKAGCTNPSVSCQLVSASGSGKTGQVVIQVNKSGSYNSQSYGLYVETSIYDVRDASSNLAAVVLKSIRNRAQEMIVQLNPSSSYLHGGRRIPIPDGDNCACEYNEQGKWTGKFLLNKLNLDGSYSQTSVDRAPEGVSCPASCPEKHHCETPQESGDGNYYCSESSPGKGDGSPCSESQYNAQCKKVNCSPDVTIPSFCTSVDANDTIKGTISDININNANSCNNGEVNLVNTCVIQKQVDAANNTFESTIDGINNNPYCKVWCKEKADFTLPAGRFSTSGGYFTLSMSIEGERNCYISGADDPSKGIDEEKFNNKIYSLQRQMISQWNEYNKWKYAVDNFNSIYKHITTKHSSKSSECCEKECEEGENGGISCTCVKDGCSGETIEDDYYKFNWSYVIYSISGRAQYRASTSSASHQDGGPGSCPGSCCGGECTEGEQGDLNRALSYFRNNMNSALANLKSTVNEIYTHVKLFNSCSGVVSNSAGTDLISGNQNSTGWENKQNFAPKVDFEYHEDYLNNLEGVFIEKGRSGTSSNSKYCEKTIDNSKDAIDEQYNCKSSQSSSVPTEAKPFVICNSENCTTIDINLSKAGRVEKSKKVKVTYGPETSFSTYSPYGTIKVGQDGVSTLYTNLPDNALPVSLIRTTGVFPFKFTFSDVGQFNNSDSLGRLMGSSQSVLIAFNNLPETQTCTNESVSNTTEGGYVCQYINNCPECTGSCDESGCVMETPDGETCTDHCIGLCKNCIFGGSSSGYTFRPISLNNMQPNAKTKLEATNRVEASRAWNWNNEYKGLITKKQIEEDGESIYEAPQFSVTLTPTNLSKIREFNKKAGSFVNAKLPDGMSNSDGEDNAIYCQKITLKGKEYNVKCRSTFLDYMEAHKGEYGTITERVTRDDDGFELFTDNSVSSITGCGSANGYACLAQEGIGPSWRVRKTGGNS